MIKVLVNGAKGKMGRQVVTTIRGEPDLELVGEADLGDSLAVAIQSCAPDVVVDFTHPSCVVENTRTILDGGARPVVGTTGFQPAEIEELRELCTRLRRGALIAPNFAIGAVLLMKFAAEAARYLPDVEIIELHHNQKADAPSGTALKTAELIGMRQGEPEGMRIAEKELLAGARGAQFERVRIHSVRLPGLVAHQEVLLGGVGQLLSLRHDSLNRESFMPGVALGIRRVMQLDELVYGLEHLLSAP